MPVRVAFDLRWVSRDPGGVTTYSLNLLDGLVRQASEFRYTAVINPGGEELITRYLSRPIPGLEFLRVDYSPFSPGSQVLLPGRLRHLNTDVYHSPYYLGFLLPIPFREVVTVHDLMAYLFPDRCPEARSVRYFRLFAAALRRSLANASRIMAVSEMTARDIRQTFPQTTAKVEVVYNGVNPIFFQARPAPELDDVGRRFGVASPLILYVGRRDPNRNLVPLIRAVSILHGQGIKAHLLVSGRPDARYPEPESAVRDLGLTDFVRFPGFTELNDLQALYQAADVLALPSSYEGFGLPPLEAMASGTPVVCSNRASIPEVVGDAAVFIEPEDAQSIAEGIRRVLGDNQLRADLIRRGRSRAQQFTWEAAARHVMATYRKIMSNDD